MHTNKIAHSDAEAILESITDAFFSLDLDWRFTYVNQQANSLMGFHSGELVGTSLWDACPGLAGSKFEDMYRKAARDQISESFTSYYPDHERWYEVRCYASAEGMSVYFRDATVRIQAEEKLRESETRFRLMANAIPQIVWIADAEGRVEFFNQQWIDYSDDQTGGIAGQLIAEHFVHPDDQHVTREAWRSASQCGHTFVSEHRLRSKAGDYRWFLTRAEPHRDAAGAIVRWFGTSTDIQEQRLISEELAQVITESEQRHRLYETFLSHTPDFAYVWDLNHRFVYANEVLLEMWDKSWDEAIGKNCLELGYEPWHAEMHDREIEQVRATKLPVHGEVPFHGAFGPRIYDYILVPILGPDGGLLPV